MNRPPRLPLLALGLLVWIGFMASVWIQSGGHLMAPLDDTFIHLQYARRLSEGHFFSYAPGVGYSSGATSWLWVAVLTPMHWVGIGGVKALGLSISLCGFLFLASALFLHRLAHELAGPAAGLLVGILFVLNGHAAWAYLSGMETGLFTALILLALAGWRAWTDEELRGGWRVFLVALALLPLARPEGWALWAAALILVVARGIQLPPRRRDVWPVAAMCLPGLVAALLHRWKAGDWATTGMILKGLWSQPELNLFDKIEGLSSHLWSIAVRFYNNVQPDPLQAHWRGQWVRPFAPPLAAVLAAVGGGMGLIAEWRRGRIGTVSLVTVWWAAGLLTAAMATAPFVHNQRYLVPWTPLMLLLAGVGLARVVKLFDPHHRNVLWGIGAFWILLSLAATAWWTVEYGRNGSDIFHQHRRMSWIVADTAAPHDRVAVTDAGVIAYYSGRPVFDLVGLCSSAEQARTFRDGEGSVFERLERMTRAERPAWLVTYPGWWSKDFPLGAVRATAGLLSTTITSGPDLTLYRVDPAPLGSGRLPSRYLDERGMYLPDEQIPGDPADILEARLESEFWQVVDEVDVADRESEAAHGYRRVLPPGQRPTDPDAWPRPWNRVRGLLADLPEAQSGDSYVDAREAAWSLTRDVPIQEHLFAYYLDHGAVLATTGTLIPPALAAGAEALRQLDRITTPTFADLLDIFPPASPEAIRIVDGGRGVAEAEEFSLTLRPGSPALLLWRTDAASTLTLDVQAGGVRLEPWVIAPAEAGRWREAWLRLPPEILTKPGPTPIRVAFFPPGLPMEGVALSAHWWGLQPAEP